MVFCGLRHCRICWFPVLVCIEILMNPWIIINQLSTCTIWSLSVYLRNVSDSIDRMVIKVFGQCPMGCSDNYVWISRVINTSLYIFLYIYCNELGKPDSSSYCSSYIMVNGFRLTECNDVCFSMIRVQLNVPLIRWFTLWIINIENKSWVREQHSNSQMHISAGVNYHRYSVTRD